MFHKALLKTITLPQKLGYMVLLVCSSSVMAFDWTATNAQILYGDNFELAEQQRQTFTLEHANGWKYGHNFFFVDFYNNQGAEVYAEVYSYLSLNKITGRDLSFGPVKDISVLAGINISNRPEFDDFKAYLAGVELDLGNQYFDYLTVSAKVYKNDGVSGQYGMEFTPVWSLPFNIGPAKFKFRGFVDFRTANTNNNKNFSMLAQPQLLYDVGDLINWRSDTVYVGTEYCYWFAKYGIEGLNESAFQAMVIGFF